MFMAVGEGNAKKTHHVLSRKTYIVSSISLIQNREYVGNNGSHVERVKVVSTWHFASPSQPSPIAVKHFDFGFFRSDTQIIGGEIDNFVAAHSRSLPEK